MTLISAFDPWHSERCTCSSKLTLNPYTGCDHGCVYCYASSYIPRFHHCRPKKDLVPRLRKESLRLNGEILSMSNSSDPYPRLEAQLELTRKSLEILSKRSCRIQIVTKSNLVLRDIDLLKKIPTVVSMTITTDEDDLARLIEPNAPPPSERLEAVRTLIDLGVPTSIRIDPIIPYINDNPQRLIRVLADLGVKHITSSTYKAKPDNWRRLSAAMPCVAERIKPLYFERCEKIGGYSCLPRQLRSELMQTVATLAKKHGIAFGTCREQLSHLNTGKCDGSWLFPLEATG